MLIQQGDVLIKKVEMDLEGCKKVERKEGRLILAEGEATGHAHAIDDNDAHLYISKEGEMYLMVEEEVTVKHEEHASQSISKGIWKIERVKEYDHFEEEARNVID